MSQRSFESINYMLRPNKNVERKLIARTLLRLDPTFAVRDYRYIGLGSMWFTDFVLMHKVVGISDLVTIERQISRSKRVAFNKPFGCIDVVMGTAGEKLGEVLNEKRGLVWLDYDGPLRSATSGDLETAVGALSSGSLVLVSVNAKVEQLSNNKIDDETVSQERYLAEISDVEVTAEMAKRLTRVDFPELVADLIHDRLRAAVLASKPGCEYSPIWTFQYADDAVMVTVGGMIADQADTERLASCRLSELPFLSAAKPFEIALPILTEKEKRSLDRLMPAAARINAKSLEFELKDAEIEAYRTFYLDYPIFNEMAA